MHRRGSVRVGSWPSGEVVRRSPRPRLASRAPLLGRRMTSCIPLLLVLFLVQCSSNPSAPAPTTARVTNRETDAPGATPMTGDAYGSQVTTW